MTVALLIIDVQKSAVTDTNIIKNIEALQHKYADVFASKFVNLNSPLIKYKIFDGYDDTALAFSPLPRTKVFEKNIYSSFIPELKQFDEVHLCGFDTDGCVYKTAMDLIEADICPKILLSLCGSENTEYHNIAVKLLERNIGKNNLIY